MFDNDDAAAIYLERAEMHEQLAAATADGAARKLHLAMAVEYRRKAKEMRPETPRHGLHVVPGMRGWRVKRADRSKATSVHATQAEAITAAKRIARTEPTILYIHGQDGRIHERISYGGDELVPAT
jgi:hypothetical protein